MFCPKCATQNVDGASFCRSCGANISLIPHALTGSLSQAEPDDPYSRSRRRKRRDRDVEPSLEKGIVNIFMGIGFIVAALAVVSRFPGGIFWGWSFFIPGFSCLGRGVASIVAARRNKTTLLVNRSAYLPDQHSARLVESSVPRTGELRRAVPSVTEGTTRHLSAEAPTKHLDSWESQKPS
jgi:hypothetical protein